MKPVFGGEGVVVPDLKAFVKTYLARACLCAGVWSSMNVLAAGP